MLGTRSLQRFEENIGALSVRQQNLANVHLFVESMPFGGTGAAGIGHYYGKYGFDALTHAMLISPPDVAIEHRYPPFTGDKNEALQGWFEY